MGGGLFDNEEEAAMQVNLLCDKIGIKHKNQIIVNKEIKVEDENILNAFKNECENRFMKSTDEENFITTTSGENQKRKRKQKEELIMNDVVQEKVEITIPNHKGNELV